MSKFWRNHRINLLLREVKALRSLSEVEEVSRIWLTLDGREFAVCLKHLSGEVVHAERSGQRIQGIELKAWIYDLLLGLRVALPRA